MDLLDFDGSGLYFDEPLSDDVAALLTEASNVYGVGDAELPLLQAYMHAPKSLTVLVALYRFYYYQHRLDEALCVALRALDAAGERLGITVSWRELTIPQLGYAVLRSMGMVRFYLLSLKGAGYLCCRLGRWQEGSEMLRKVSSLDPVNRLGAEALLEVVMRAAGEGMNDDHRLAV